MFKGEKIILRLLEIEDAKEIMKYFNNYDFKKNLAGVIPVSIKDEEDFIRHTWESKEQGTDYVFAIDEQETNNIIGSCGLHSINWINKSCVFGIGIWNPTKQGKGYGKDATITILRFAFYVLGLHSVRLNVHDFNKRAISLYKKIGFKENGKMRQSYFISGEFIDTILMDILDDEFKSLYKNIW